MPKAPYKTTMKISELELRHPELSLRWQHANKRFAIVDAGSKAYTVRRERRGKDEYWYMYSKDAAGRVRNVYVGKEASSDTLLIALDRLRAKLHNIEDSL